MKTFTAIRFPVALVLATLLTAALFTLLKNLTATSFQAIETKSIPIDFTKVRADTAVETKREPKPELIRPPVITDLVKVIDGEKAVGPAIIIIDPVTANVPKQDRPTFNYGSDRDVQPLVRVAPDYPPRAQARGIEGWVRVRFNITTTGSVADVAVVASTPQGEFEKAATDAIRRWRYNPKVEDGIAVERRGVETLLRFELPQN